MTHSIFIIYNKYSKFTKLHVCHVLRSNLKNVLKPIMSLAVKSLMKLKKSSSHPHGSGDLHPSTVLSLKVERVFVVLFSG